MAIPHRPARGGALARLGLVVLFAALVLLPILGAQAAERRVALVVGVGAYKNVPTLPNPPNDARDIAAALTRLGFSTETVIDPDRLILEGAVRRLGHRDGRNAECRMLALLTRPHGGSDRNFSSDSMADDLSTPARRASSDPTSKQDGLLRCPAMSCAVLSAKSYAVRPRHALT